MSSAQRIVKNALANGAGLACEAIISFCMLPFILHRIGEAAYGVWAFTIAISGYMGILNLGFRPAINKYVAQYNATGEWQKIRDMLQASLFSYSACGSLIILSCLFLSLNVSTFFNIPVEFQKTAAIFILLTGFQMAAGLVAVVFGGVISGLQRYEINNGIEIFVMLSRTAIIVSFLGKYPSLNTIAAAHFSMVLLGDLITVIWAYKLADIAPLKLFRIPSGNALGPILKFSLITFVISTVGRIISYIDLPLIASIITIEAVTMYTIGSRLIKYLTNFVEVLSNVLAPATSDLQARDDMEGVQSIFLYSTRVASLVVFPTISFLMIFGDVFLKLWLGKEYPESYRVMCILGAANLVYLPQISTIPMLFGLARHKIVMYMAILSGCVTVILAFVLGARYGLQGIAFALGFPQALIYGIICPVYVTAHVGLPYWSWLYSTYLKAMLPVVPFVLFLFGCRSCFHVNSWPFFLAVAIVAGLFYLVIAWFTVISRDDKKRILSLLPEFGKT